MTAEVLFDFQRSIVDCWMCKIGISRAVALSFEHHKVKFMPLTFSKAFVEDP